MAKTLRVRTRTGWVTKPSADLQENRLTGEEVDDNFLALEDALAAKQAFEIGHCLLVPSQLDMPGWLPMNGAQYTDAEYPALGALLGGVQGFSVESGVAAGGVNVRSLAMSHNNQWLAVGHTGSPFLRIISTYDWATVATPAAPTSTVNPPAFSPKDDYIAVPFQASPYFRVVDTSDWSTVAGTPTLAGLGNGAAWSPDGNYVAIAHSSGNGLTVVNTSDWSVVSGTPVLPGSGLKAAFSPDGTLLAVAHLTSPFLTVLNTSDWSTVGGTPTPPASGDLSFSPDGAYLAYGSSSAPYLNVYQVSGWSAVSLTATFTNTVTGLDFSPDGDYLALATFMTGQCAQLIDTTTWDTVSGVPLAARDGQAEDVAYSQYGDFVAVGRGGGTAGELEILNVEDQTVFTVPDNPAPRPDLEWRIRAEDV